MANIRIDLDSPVIDGQSLVFKSPVNCSDITGLIIYFPGGSSTIFDFADAHGNNVGSLNLFSENALVKVLLDTELNRAYVQNADTNAYLEGELAKRLLAIESPDYPGCYYRMVDGEAEWVNPPMTGNVGYRTIERFMSLPVYSMQVARTFTANVGTSGIDPISKSQSITIEGAKKLWVDSCIYSIGNSFFNDQGSDIINASCATGNDGGELSISCNTDGNIARVTAYVTVKYTKN